METSQTTPVSSTADMTSTPAPTAAPAMGIAPAPPTAATEMRPRASGTIGPGIVVIALSAVLVVAALVLLRYTPRRVVSGAAVNTQAETPAPSVQVAAGQPDPPAAPLAPLASLAATVPVAAVARAQAPKTVIEKARQTRVATTTSRSAADVVPLPRPSAVLSGAGEPATRTVALTEPSANGSAAASTPTSDQAAVTITGCLEATTDYDQFRLTDTEGADAPKARSWRSGFLKKRSSPVALVELSDVPALRKYVGYRVAATGLLTSRELRVRSLQSAGASCN
jgi:hypothetical protein